MSVRSTGGILGTDEDVGGLGQPLHELGDAFGVILSLTQRAHHGAQDAPDNFCEQLRVERLSCTSGVRCRAWSRRAAGSGWSWRWSKDGLGGLEDNDKEKRCCSDRSGTKIDPSITLTTVKRKTSLCYKRLITGSQMMT